MSLLPTIPPPCNHQHPCGSDRDGDKDIASVFSDYHYFSCWYCWSLLRSVWLPVWRILTEATAAMMATVAAMAVDMVDMAAATAVTEAMVATVVVIMAERHLGMLLTIDCLFHSPEFVLRVVLLDQESNSTWNCLQHGTPSFHRCRDADTIELRNQI